MPMTRAEKEEFIKKLNAQIVASKLSVFTEYRGVSSNEMNDLRKALRDTQGGYQVIKNTLFRRAAKGTPAENFSETLVGPAGIAFTNGDPAQLAKALKQFEEDIEAFDVHAGVLGDKQLSKDDLKALSDLPSRDELLAQLLAQMMAPVQSFHGVLSAVPRNFVMVLEAIRAKKEAEGA